MRKILTSTLVLTSFTFFGCTEKKTACECMEMTPGIMMKLMTGSISEKEADKQMEACNWMNELSEEERMALIKDCGIDIENKAKEAFQNSSEELKEAYEEMVEELEESEDEKNESF